MVKKIKLSPIVWKGEGVEADINNFVNVDEEKDPLKEIEEQIKILCASWCALEHVKRMDIIYLGKDEVIFGEL